jgi:lipopolysaccharide/colanic/teichoic acid biosynthesis glycosyltransferase
MNVVRRRIRSREQFVGLVHRPLNRVTVALPFVQVSPRDALYLGSKRTLDVAGALILLAAASLIWLAVSLAVRLSGPGPILFRQRRLGRNGREFWCYKFRTMVVDAERQLDTHSALRERFATRFKIDDDPRVTRTGRFLRRTSLDELPQLINVLRGEMSLIGPRPIVPRELEKYGPHADKLLTVKPGLGGLWQVSGRSDTTYEERVALDMRYIDQRSLALDLRLLFLTALAVLQRRGAR